MIKSLVKHGNSWALVIDKPILELLKLDPTQPVDLSTPDGTSLVIKAVLPVDRASRLAEANAWMHERYSATFKTLAG